MLQALQALSPPSPGAQPPGSAVSVEQLSPLLQALRENLVEPVLRPGLVGVDFADYASALSRGGEIHAWSARGLDEAGCVARLAEAVGHRRIAAACLHIRSPVPFGLGSFDETCVSIQRHFPELAGDECLFVVAVTPEERMDVGLSLLVVSGRGDE